MREGLAILGLVILGCTILLGINFLITSLMSWIFYSATLKRSGISWEAAAEAVNQGRGVFIVDYGVGPVKGFGNPTIWFSREIPQNADEIYAIIWRSAQLTNCPKRARDVKVLRMTFTESAVRENHFSRL
jgi:hypothetical protein